MTVIKGSNWQTGIKDGSVYLEIWDGSKTERILDTTFTIEQARGVASNLIKAADALEGKTIAL